MKTIMVTKWTEKSMIDGQIEEVEVDVTTAISSLINSRDPQSIPKGFDMFRMFHRISLAFEKSKTSGTIELDDIDYDFIKKTILSDIPSQWGQNINIVNAIEEFMKV